MRLAVLAATALASAVAMTSEPAEPVNAPGTTGVSVVRLKTNATPEPLGIDTQVPRLG
jgi:hypothetical protein